MDSFGDSGIDGVRFDRLQYVIDTSVTNCTTDKVEIVMAANDDKFNAAGEFADPFHQIKAVT
ncbi:hypothetical protein D3C71_1766850 [compost metagenome]